MTVVLKQGDCILRGEHSTFAVVEKDLLLTDAGETAAPGVKLTGAGVGVGAGHPGDG